MKKERRNLIVGVVIGVIIVIVIILIYNASKTQPKEELTEEDFKIISASWNTYHMKYNSDGNYVIDTPKREFNWDLICGCGDKPCKTGGWHITTQASEDLRCETIIDDRDDDNDVDLGSGIEISEGLTKHSFVEGENDEIYTNFDVTKSHEIIVCCIAKDLNKENKVCKSIILEAKCP